MTSNLCELVKAFASDPRGLADKARAWAGEMLAHVDSCDACEAVLDTATDAEAVFEVLADEEALLPPGERQALDRWTAPDTRRKEEIRAAVEELVRGLQPEAAEAAAKFDAGMLYATTEAVSLAIRRCIDRDRIAPLVELGSHGEVTVDRKEAIPKGGLAAEIAVFTDLWAPLDPTPRTAERRPSDDAHRLARWTFLALRDQRHLLRHFRALPPLFGLPFMSEDRVTLLPLRREERIDNLYERWRPDWLGGQQRLYIGRWTQAGAGRRQREVLVVEAAQVASGLRNKSVADRLRDLGLGEDAEVFVGPEDRFPAAEQVTTIESLEVKSLGEFEEMVFSGRSVELRRASGTSVKLHGERVIWRWDLLEL